ncbi:DUF397 domain-containing protein [Streptomyces scopuliridis]|uniref:DUF397 domain-containing protein n=1 Tax=Streptomyces scopuliridis TaxID=452529 RepID=UPI0036C9DD08
MSTTATELAWFKSSYSGSSGDSCVEVALSIHDTGQVETVHVRDSKVRPGPATDPRPRDLEPLPVLRDPDLTS